VTHLHLLDRPVWNALATRWRGFGVGGPMARRLHPQYGPFAASVDASQESGAALNALIPEGEAIWVVEKPDFALPPCSAQRRTDSIDQMVLTHLSPLAGAFEIVALTEQDGGDMRALAHLTQPGPFHTHTHLLGDFVGVKQRGRLVAMAGERMKLEGYSEVSGVCTHPDSRGQGYAGVLMSVVAERILRRGEMPFLHSFSGNASAIKLYERIGFQLRCPIILTRLSR
jgi:ribosomal protein S18 acetylase RimI-like enzyme